MAVMSIMMMFSFAAAASVCNGDAAECKPTVCCTENKVAVLGACKTEEDATCRGCGDFGAAETCMEFKTLNESLMVNLGEALINSTTTFKNQKNLWTVLMTEEIVAAAKKFIMSPADHLAVATFQQGTLECKAPMENGTAPDDGAAPGGSDDEPAEADGICTIDGECCGVPALPSCLEKAMCNCEYFCDADKHKDIISAYTSVTNMSAIIVLQQQNLTMVNGSEENTRMALLKGLNGEMQQKLSEANEFFSSAATLGGCALVLAMVMNF